MFRGRESRVLQVIGTVLVFVPLCAFVWLTFSAQLFDIGYDGEIVAGFMYLPGLVACLVGFLLYFLSWRRNKKPGGKIDR